MFQFPRFSSSGYVFTDWMTPHYRRRVFPFGDPRVKGCSAPHRGLSQPSTSFIDSWCQGIHRKPLTILTVIRPIAEAVGRKLKYPYWPCAVFKVHRGAHDGVLPSAVSQN